MFLLIKKRKVPCLTNEKEEGCDLSEGILFIPYMIANERNKACEKSRKSNFRHNGWFQMVAATCMEEVKSSIQVLEIRGRQSLLHLLVKMPFFLFYSFFSNKKHSFTTKKVLISS